MIHKDLDELQKMLNTTNDEALKYPIEFGAPKCKVVRDGKGNRS